MIEKQRNTLNTYRVSRENEIACYKKRVQEDFSEFNLPSLTKEEAAEYERRHLARLIIGLSLNQAKQRINSILPPTNIRGLRDQITAAEALFRQRPSLSIQMKNFLRLGSFRELLHGWENAANSSSTKGDRTAFRHNQISKDLKNRDVNTFTNLADTLCLCAEQIIKENPKSKETYLAYLSSIYQLIVSPFVENEMLFAREICPASLIDVLTMLEKKALKSTSILPYKHLFLCLAMIYAPLPAKQLFNLPAPDEETLCLRDGDRCFPVSQLFIDLWKCFGISEYLFSPTLWNAFIAKDPGSPLNQITKGWGRNARLPFSLTPRALRSLV